jgi:hypothetical protein
MEDVDIRWKQRFENYKKALQKLKEADGQYHRYKDNPDTSLADVIKEGLVQCFEFTHELAWNVMEAKGAACSD